MCIKTNNEYMTIGKYFKEYNVSNVDLPTGPYNSICDY